MPCGRPASYDAYTFTALRSVRSGLSRPPVSIKRGMRDMRQLMEVFDLSLSVLENLMSGDLVSLPSELKIGMPVASVPGNIGPILVFYAFCSCT